MDSYQDLIEALDRHTAALREHTAEMRKPKVTIPWHVARFQRDLERYRIADEKRDGVK